MVSLFSLSTALAAPGDSLRTALEAEEPPAMAASCEPVRPLLDLLATMAPHLPEPDDASRTLPSLVRPGGAEALGVDPDGALFVSAEEQRGFEVRLPFSGTEEQAAAALGGLGDFELDSTGQGRWTWATEAGGSGRASLVDGVLSIGVRGNQPRGLMTAIAKPDLVDGLAGTSGCVVYFSGQLPEGGPAQVGETFAAALWLPLGGDGSGMTRMRFLVDAGAPGTLSEVTPAPLLGSSNREPSIVGVVAVPLHELVSDPVFGEMLERDLSDFDWPFHIESGATFAMFGDPKDRDFAFVARFSNRKGKPFSAKKLTRATAKFLESEGFEVEVTSRQTLAAQGPMLQGQRLYGASGRGLLVLGTDLQTVGEAQQNAGTAWLTGSAATMTETWPITLVVRPPPNSGFLPPGAPPIAPRFGIRTVGNYWEVGFAVEADQGKALMGLAASMASSNFVKMANRARQVELPANVSSLHVAVLAHDAAYDEYPELPPAPRSPQALDDQAVDFVATDAAWDDLGWAPEGEVRGVYWVEVTDGGFTVHGVADLDGDGRAAHFVQSRDDAQPRQLTPEDVY